MIPSLFYHPYFMTHSKSPAVIGRASSCLFRGLFFAEILFTYAAQGADIIVGKILERYAAVLFGVIDIAAYIAYILFHSFLLFIMIYRSPRK